jgi:Type II secretion system (T2SS), protein E, N-terminal domain
MSTKEAKPDAPPKGVVAASEPGGRSGFLSDVIVELGFAKRDTVEKAVRAARSPGTTVARVLVESGAVTEEQLAHATAERYGIAYVDLGSFKVEPGAANLIKASAARRYQAVPVGFMGGGLLVAMADPADALGVNDIAVMTKMDVKPAVASRPALDALLESLPLTETTGDDTGEEPEPSPEATEEPETAASSAVFWQASDEDDQGAREELPADSEEVERLRERLTATEAELDQAQARARDAELAAERADTLEKELGAVKTELERARADVDVRTEELDLLRERLTGAETELVRVRAELEESGRANRETADRIEELEDADRRAEQARQALAELREESERELEQLAMAEREVRGRLEESEARRAEMEKAQQSMRDALRSLADPDA